MLLINDLCKQAIENRKLILKSNGLQFRNFIELTEVCRIVDFFMCNDLKSENSGVFNVGSDYSKKVLDMAELIQDRCSTVLGFKPELYSNKFELRDSNILFKYSIDRLKTLGMRANEVEHINEIDSLLKFCQLSFGKDTL
jgi:UDP-glucose 4-epimerase